LYNLVWLLQIWTAWSERSGKKAGKKHGNMIAWSERSGKKAGKKCGNMIAWSERSSKKAGKKAGSWIVTSKSSPVPGGGKQQGRTSDRRPEGLPFGSAVGDVNENIVRMPGLRILVRRNR